MFGFIKKLFGAADVNKDGKVDATDAKVVVEEVKAEVKQAAVEVKAAANKTTAKAKTAVKKTVAKAKPARGRKPKAK
jgi:hypothetical protein